jgi:hypothetical protein
MKPEASDARKPAGRDGLGMWNAFLGVLGLIVFASLAGRQLYEMIPTVAVWALVAGGGLGVLVALAILYEGALPRRALIIGIALGSVAFAAAVFAGAMTVAEIAHVVLFGALGLILSPLAPRLALPLLLAVSAGDELLQAFLPWRVGSLFDVALNVICGFGSYALVRYHRLTAPAHQAGSP